MRVSHIRSTITIAVASLAMISLTSCSAVENWLMFDRNKTVDAILSPTTPATLQSIDDDFVSVSLTDTTAITWVGANPLLPGDTYEVAVGSTAGASDIVGWTPVGTATSWSQTGLSLTLNSNYYASVRIRESSGDITTTLNGNGWKVVATATNFARYSVAPNWNDYAKTATPTVACAGFESGYYACLHGGEKRRVPWPAAANCTGFDITDELGAFDWACDQTGGAGNVFFYTRGLKKSKGLADLVNATSWKKNRIVLTQTGVPVAATARATWWTNPVVALPASPVAGTPVPLTASTIYTVASNMTTVGGYDLNIQNSMAVVTLPGATLTLASNATAATAIIDGSTGPFYVWLEGEFTSELASGELYNTLGTHSVARRIRTSGFDMGIGDGSMLTASSFISQVYATRNNIGIRIKGDTSIYQDITSIGNADAGIELGDFSTGNILQNVLVANNATDGIYLHNATNTNVIGLTSVNNGVYGISAIANTGTTVHNVFARNNNNPSVSFMGGTRETSSQIVTDKISSIAQNTSKFTSNLVIINATPNCARTAGTNPGIVDVTCANQGSSNATLTLQSTKGNLSFVGQLASTDVANASNMNGTSPFAAITDWVHFSSVLRGWGSGGAYPSLATQGACTSGTCQIWDYILKPSDLDLRNVTGNGLTQNAAFVNAAACPAILNGNVASVSINGTPRTYLSNAMEIVGTGGNDNGLCESNETCV